MLALIRQKRVMGESEIIRMVMREFGYSYRGAQEKFRELRMGRFIIPRGNKWVCTQEKKGKG